MKSQPASQPASRPVSQLAAAKLVTTPATATAADGEEEEEDDDDVRATPSYHSTRLILPILAVLFQFSSVHSLVQLTFKTYSRWASTSWKKLESTSWEMKKEEKNFKFARSFVAGLFEWMDINNKNLRPAAIIAELLEKRELASHCKKRTTINHPGKKSRTMCWVIIAGDRYLSNYLSISLSLFVRASWSVCVCSCSWKQSGFFEAQDPVIWFTVWRWMNLNDGLIRADWLVVSNHHHSKQSSQFYNS